MRVWYIINHIYIIVYILEGTGPLADPLPVVFETTEDPTINNLTRNDINCDKTGTCYDGTDFFKYFNNTYTYIVSYKNY